MKNSARKIRTSHGGRLPAPDHFQDLPQRLTSWQPIPADEMTGKIEPAIAGIVKRQVEIGIDCVGDGEYWAGLGFPYWSQLMSGLSTRPLNPGEVGSTRESTRERDTFQHFYAEMDRVGTLFCIPGEKPVFRVTQRCVAKQPIQSKGVGPVKRQIDSFKTVIARAGVPVDEAFIPALAPGWLDHFIYNEHYKTDEEFVYALAEAMADKYRAIADAGFILQLDDPGLVT